MKKWSSVVWIFVAAFFGAWDAVSAQPDARLLMQQSIANYQHDRREALGYRYVQSDATTSAGQRSLEVSEVVPLDGTPYDRLIAKNGQPLTPEEKKKEQDKFDRTLHRRTAESPQERAARLSRYESEWSFLRDLPNAYDFKILGEEAVNGRSSWIVGLTPRRDFVPTTSRGSMLRHIEGRLWIDKQDVQWAKAEAHVIDAVSIGWILARIGPGAEIRFNQVRVENGLWLPGKIDITGNAKIMMVHKKDLQEELVFSDFRKTSQSKPAEAISARRSAR